MFYEIQFKLGKVAQLTQASLSSTSLPLVENISNAAIIFDEYKNCLFLNHAAEKIFGDRVDISLIKDWVRDQIHNLPQGEVAFELQELPIKLEEIEEMQLQVEVILNDLNELNISNDFCRELNQHQALPIQEAQVEPLYTKETLTPQPAKTIRDTNYDRLTGLPNYSLLFDYIKEEINFCQQRLGYKFVILFVDVNRFKAINSSLGRIIGDRLLIAIAQRLQTSLRAQDLIARMGNDEFVILLSNIEHLNYATNVAERIYRELAIPFNLGGYEVFIEASIGIAVGNKEYSNPENVLRDAELAVSDAKRQSKSPYQIFNQSMRGKALTLLQLENDLRKAIQRQEFILHYQPIVCLNNNKIKGFEVLVRWRHPEQGSTVSRRIYFFSRAYRIDCSFRLLGSKRSLSANVRMASKVWWLN